MKMLNEYFFGVEKISLHDFLWFYGVLSSAIILTVIVAYSMTF